MADAAARREARRQRILENSHNRLQLITGKCCEENIKESTDASSRSKIHESIGALENSATSKNSIPNGSIVEAEFELLLTQQDDVGAGDRNNDIISLHRPTVTESVRTSSWLQIFANKYDIVLLGLLLQIVHNLFALSMENTLFFLPLVLYGVTKSYWLPKQNNSTIGNVLLLLNLNGISPNTLHTVINMLQWVSSFSQEACIFLFSTICLQALWDVLKEIFIT